jgi:hypothetical protein
MSESVKSYQQAASAMRDTTKWIVALVPGAGSVLVVTTLVPDWSRNDLGAARRGAVLALVVVAAAAGILLVALAVRVLRTEIAGWGDLRTRVAREDPTDQRTVAYALDASGILPLAGFSDVAAVVTASERKREADDPDPVLAANAAVDFADYTTTADAFRAFLIACGVSVAVIAVCFAIASRVVADAPATIDRSTNVVAHLLHPPASLADCAPDPTTIDAVATGGNWSSPRIVLASGPCEGRRVLVTRAVGFVAPAK